MTKARLLEELNHLLRTGAVKLPPPGRLFAIPTRAVGELAAPFQRFGEAVEDAVDAMRYAFTSVTYGIDPAFRVTREELVRHELRRVVDWEDGSGLFHFSGPPVLRCHFTQDAIDRGWLRSERGQLFSTGLGRCVAELHRSWPSIKPARRELLQEAEERLDAWEAELCE